MGIGKHGGRGTHKSMGIAGSHASMREIHETTGRDYINMGIGESYGKESHGSTGIEKSHRKHMGRVMKISRG